MQNKLLFKPQKGKSKEESGLIEGHLCHGFFGVAHIYEKLNDYKPNNEFKMASSYWFNTGLKYITEVNLIEDYKYLYGEEWVSSDSLLMGISGIGLSLIDKIRVESHKDSNWDRCLLLS